MRTKKERILLDAFITDVIESKAFVADLKNGHRVTAWVRTGRQPRMGERVILEMTPGDMSQGRIVRMADGG